ncbi:MAG: hypothetical protein K1X28_07465 [Parachlamydiales bacterium]|nr:hypothetical protein [Parachlamydiales bacterium]
MSVRNNTAARSCFTVNSVVNPNEESDGEDGLERKVDLVHKGVGPTPRYSSHKFSATSFPAGELNISTALVSTRAKGVTYMEPSVSVQRLNQFFEIFPPIRQCEWRNRVIDIDVLGPTPDQLRTVSYLSAETLSLSCCTFSDAQWEALLKKLPMDTRTFLVSYCPDFSDNMLAKLMSVSMLSSLTLRGCPKITSNAIVSLLKWNTLPVQQLVLENLDCVDDAAIKDILECSPALRKISIIGCPNVTSVGIQAILSRKWDEVVISKGYPDATVDALRRVCNNVRVVEPHAPDSVVFVPAREAEAGEDLNNEFPRPEELPYLSIFSEMVVNAREGDLTQAALRMRIGEISVWYYLQLKSRGIPVQEVPEKLKITYWVVADGQEPFEIQPRTWAKVDEMIRKCDGSLDQIVDAILEAFCQFSHRQRNPGAKPLILDSRDELIEKLKTLGMLFSPDANPWTTMQGIVRYISEKGGLARRLDFLAMQFNLGKIPQVVMNLGFPHLRYLRLSQCGIRTLPEEFFPLSPNLEEVYLDRNKIRGLPEHIFQFAPHLRRVGLEDNEITLLPRYPGFFLLVRGNKDGSDKDIAHSPCQLVLTGNKIREIFANWEGWRTGFREVHIDVTSQKDIEVVALDPKAIPHNISITVDVGSGKTRTFKGVKQEGGEIDDLP